MNLSHNIAHIFDLLICKYTYLYLNFEIIDYTAGSPAMTIHRRQGCRLSVAVGASVGKLQYYNSVYSFLMFKFKLKQASATCQLF